MSEEQIIEQPDGRAGSPSQPEDGRAVSPKPPTPRGNRKTRKGTVVSKSGIKSVIVLVERRERHPIYGKVVRISKKFSTHDEDNTAKVGDKVTIMETRPLSATKRWRIVKEN
jgi:small subunit ribosomal protein S17